MFQVPDWELLHAIVGLYDSYLPEITPEVLYNTLTCRSSLTLVFLKEPEGISKVKTVNVELTTTEHLLITQLFPLELLMNH